MKLVNLITSAAMVLLAASCGTKVTPDDMKFSRFLVMEGSRYENIGNLEQAEKSYRSAIEKNPGNTDAAGRLEGLFIAQKRYEEALELVDDSPLDDFRRECRKGIILEKKGDTAGAMKRFRKSSELKADYPTPLYHMGMIEEKSGDLKKAKAHYAAYCSVYVKSPFRKAEINHIADAENGILRIDHPEEAESYFRALDMFRNDDHAGSGKLLMKLKSPQALTLRGRILRCGGKDADALKVLEKAGDYPPAVILRAEILCGRGKRDDVKKATELAGRVLAKNPEDQRANLLMGRILSDSGKDEEAKKYFERASSIGGDDLAAMEAREYLKVSEQSFKGLSAVVEQYSKIAVKDVPEAKKFNEMMEKLLKASGPRSESSSVRLDIYRGRGQEINALSVVDGDKGYVFVSEDLVKFVNGLPLDDDQKDSVFACVIGHELRHIVAGHSQQAYSIQGILKEDGIIAGDEEKQVAETTVNQAHEFDADRYGAVYAYLSGYNPFMMREFYTMLVTRKGDIPKNMDHPTFTERTVMLDKSMIEIKYAYAGFKKGAKALSPAAGESPEAATSRLAGCEKNFSSFLRFFPDSVQALNNMGLVYLQKALVGTMQPKFQFATWIELTPGLLDPVELQLLSMRRKAAGAAPRKTRGAHVEVEAPRAKPVDMAMLKKAEEYLLRALKKDPGYTPAQNNLGIVLAYMGRKTDAIAQFEKIVAREPGNTRAVNNLGVCQIQTGKHAEGRGNLKKAVDRGLALAGKNLSRI